LDKAVLVDEQIDDGKKLIEVLDRSKFNLVGALWFYYSESDAWKLLLVSPLVDILGPKRSYDVLFQILQDLHLPIELFLQIQVLSPKENLYTLLRRAVRTGNTISTIRFSRNTINNTYIEDALIYRLV
jgi:hypothetical protein